MRRTLASVVAAMLGYATIGICAVGCGGSEGLTPLATLPAELTAAGVYTVPAKPDVSFPVDAVHVDNAGGNVTLYYDFPAAFFAETPHVDLWGAFDGSPTFHLSGASGTSTCTLSATSLTCNEHLSGMRFDATEAMTALPDGALAQAVDSFLSEPIGVLEVSLPTH